MQLKARIRGKVQGVFFRAWTHQQARDLGLKGWVRNLPDGSVEWLAEGNRESLSELERLSRIGPPAARVESVDSDWLELDEQYTDFEIRS